MQMPHPTPHPTPHPAVVWCGVVLEPIGTALKWMDGWMDGGMVQMPRRTQLRAGSLPFLVPSLFAEEEDTLGGNKMEPPYPPAAGTAIIYGPMEAWRYGGMFGCRDDGASVSSGGRHRQHRERTGTFLNI